MPPGREPQPTAQPGADVTGLVARAEELGYSVSLRSAAARRRDTGERLPAVYIVEAPGISFRLRDDEISAWEALIHGPDRSDRSYLSSSPAVRATEPAVVAPIPARAAPGSSTRDYPQFATHLDLAAKGYVEEEFLYEGTAVSYAVPELADAVVMSDGHPYRTRLIVRRPADAAKFNGTAIVEWLNVTTFANVDQLWWEGSVAEMLMDHGFAYVGLSVQRHGLHAPRTGLVDWCPARYGSLDVTDGGTLVDDSLSFDLFSQGGMAVRKGQGGVLGGLRPQTVIAYGASQSHRFLRCYYNSVHARAGVYDGFVLGIGEGEVRRDVPGPVFRVNTETDVLRGGGATRQHDSSTLRTWEVAGASHLSYQMAQVREVMCARDGLPALPIELAHQPPLSRVPWGQVLAAAVWRMNAWIRDGRQPPCAPQIALESISPTRSTATRDGRGNAIGGIRLSQHEVATAVNQGLNSGEGLAPLWGVHIPFDRETLRTLYPSRESYVEEVRRVNEANVRYGFVLRADAERNVDEARRADLGAWR